MTERSISRHAREPKRIFIVAGEHSGDALGAKLMAEMNGPGHSLIIWQGVGGEHMEGEGLRSLFPLAEVAVMGPIAILKRLPKIIRRINEAAAAGVAMRPDVVVIIDSPEFTHPIAQRIRRRLPDVPIIDYVSPSVWAWRPGRAKKMRRYVDHVLALLPFEEEAHAQLGGPKCTYVGHPLSERLEWIHSRDGDDLARRLALDPAKPVVVVLPGSRVSEVTRLMEPFGKTLALVQQSVPGGIETVLPAVPSVRPLIVAAAARWDVPVRLIEGEDDKFAAFRLATAALAASGTVTLELGLAGTPAVVAYKVDAIAAQLRFLLKVPSIVLANLVADENVYPEFIQETATPANMAAALVPLLSDTDARRRQIAGLRKIATNVATGGRRPSAIAAEVVNDYAESRHMAEVRSEPRKSGPGGHSR
ncbi:MAG: lipid-A-disaccharide synthase [Hyphomicrobium sp.]|nr:lipid-A-disaccharide synthase [Hyphomicrobium sp.]